MARSKGLEAEVIKVDDRYYKRRDAAGRLVTSKSVAGAALFEAGSPLSASETSKIADAGRKAVRLLLKGAALQMLKAARKKAKTYLIKVECSDPKCGWTARATEKHIEKGLPTCVCGAKWRRSDAETASDDEAEERGGGDEE